MPLCGKQLRGGLTPLETGWHKGLKFQGVTNTASGGIAKSSPETQPRGVSRSRWGPLVWGATGIDHRSENL